ncbi:unnamed protein product [Phytophthora lilii]|uniref:Unnamed protein product n=1 Tax=Phytophthora lilii TaxID=2077276 RepID=A0A9W6TBM3_9STRA|nr:unnamed protein product [Phytophthora lilii]
MNNWALVATLQLLKDAVEMASHSRSSSFSDSNGSDERLQRAMEAHAALQARSSQQVANDLLSPDLGVKSSVEDNASHDPSSVLDLAAQLRNFWRREQNQYNESCEDKGPSTSVKAALQKIGSNEKDELLIHLLEQQDTLRTQRSEVAALGEKIAAQLLHQQVRCKLLSGIYYPPLNFTISWLA